MENNQPKPKWWIPVGIVVLLIVVVGGLVWWQGNKSSKDTIKIGAAYPLTGTMASYGIEYKRGAEMAVEEINKSGGVNGHKLELLFEDDQADAAKSLTAVNKLINVDKVKYILTSNSAPCQVTAPVAEKAQVIDICATVSRIGTGNYVFRDYWDMQDQGTAIGKAIKNEGINKLSILALNYPDYDFFTKGLLAETGAINIQTERFNFGDTDFKTQLTKIKNYNPDGILMYAFPGAEATKATQQIAELGLDNKKLFSGTTTYGFPFMYQTLSDTLAKMKTIDAWYAVSENNDKSKEFTQKYKNKYNEDLVGDAAYTYDDIYALSEAIEKSGDNASTKTIADNLRKTNIEGAGGKLSFDSNGNSSRNAYLQQYTNKGWVKYSN